jgi:hypothetical protein
MEWGRIKAPDYRAASDREGGGMSCRHLDLVEDNMTHIADEVARLTEEVTRLKGLNAELLAAAKHAVHRVEFGSPVYKELQAAIAHAEEQASWANMLLIVRKFILVMAYTHHSMDIWSYFARHAKKAIIGSGLSRKCMKHCSRLWRVSEALMPRSQRHDVPWVCWQAFGRIWWRRIRDPQRLVADSRLLVRRQEFAPMTYETALQLFALMSIDQQDRVTRIFDLTRAAFPNVKAAFTRAVMDECEDIEMEMLLKQPADGTAWLHSHSSY